MAKDSDRKAAALKAEKTDSMLSGLLADEKEFDRRALWRIGWWGTAAIGTVIVAVLANQGAQSWRRDQSSMAELARQAQLLQSQARDSQNQARQLTAAIETLNNDRDRLYARVTVLEQGLESVTGALAKQGPAQAAAKPQGAIAQTSAQTTAQSATQVASADSQGPAAGPSSQTAVTSGAVSGIATPAVVPVVTTSATGIDKSYADAGKQSGVSPAQPSAATLSAMAAAPALSNPPSSAASLFAPKSIMAPSDPLGSKPVDSDKTAKSDPSPEPKSSARSDDAAQAEANAGEPAEAASSPVQKTEFAVDLGTANSVNGLRALWRGLAKANGELAALSPIIMVKEGNGGLGMQLRLGAGPLNDAAAAARICASLAERQRPCETAVYDGQRLAMRDNEAGSDAAKPAAAGQKPAATTNAATGAPPAQRRRVWPQQRHGAVREPQPPAPPAAAAPPAEPPKPEPNTLSSLFHRQQPQQ
ncbi:hypothetical protein [Bradyrhizobium sp. STM 3557]|uniref:hypothetical protein n=1 Tax=Bradyrhizobium sp. STM 3557 TaxID=578920 RepID=UPI00388F9BDB